MKRTALLLQSAVILLLVSSGVAQAQIETLAEFDWANLSPSGTQSWTTPSNWTPPAMPVGNVSYPDDPNHVNAMNGGDDIIGPVTGANLSVGLTSDLTLSLPGSITIPSLKIGVDGRTTTINNGTLIFKQDEPNIQEIVTIPNPDVNDTENPTIDVPVYTQSFNGGNSLVTSTGDATTVNVINSSVGTIEAVEFNGTRSLDLAGGFTELVKNAADNTDNANVRIRSFYETYDPTKAISAHERLIISGNVTTVIEGPMQPDGIDVDDIDDNPLQINGGGSTIQEYVAGDAPTASDPTAGNPLTDAMPLGSPRGIIDITGTITGPGMVSYGVLSDASPIPTTVLHNNDYEGGTIIYRGNVILRDDNAFGTGSVRPGGPANQVGMNLIVEPTATEVSNGFTQRVIANDYNSTHDTTVLGDHSLELSGIAKASNGGGWINNLSEGATLTLSNYIYTSDFQDGTQLNRYGFYGSGETRITGRIVDYDPHELLDLTGVGTVITPAMIIEQAGTGTTHIERSQTRLTNPLHNTNLTNDDTDHNTFNDADPTNGNDQSGILVRGGALVFATLEDMSNATVESRGGAVGVEGVGSALGTAELINGGNNTFKNKFQNHTNRVSLSGASANSFSTFDNGGLLLSASDSNATIDFTSSNWSNFRDMSLAAPSKTMMPANTPFVYSGTLTPTATSYLDGNVSQGTTAYRLGGGNSELNVASGVLNNAGASLIVNNGGDYNNPNGEDRTGVGMVRLQGTHTFAGSITVTGRYQTGFLDDAANAGSTGLAETTQYQGTTLAIDSLSAIGSVGETASSLLLQGSTLRYEGGAASTNRLATIGTHGATLDASGTGAINFSSTGALEMADAQPRSINTSTFLAAGVMRRVNRTDDLVVGMEVTGFNNGQVSSEGAVTITNVIGPSWTSGSTQNGRVATDAQFSSGTATVSFSAVPRDLTLRGTNTDDNILSPQVLDSTLGSAVSIVKKDAGKWILNNAANAYTGDTVVEAGTLGILDGAGSLAGGTNLDLQEEGTLQFELAGTGVGQFDLFTFTGDAVLDGAIDVSLISGFTPSANDTFDIITATSVDATNLTLSGAAGFDFSVVGGNTLQLIFQGGGGSTDFGDFDGNGVVDARDYAVWREALAQPDAGTAGAESTYLAGNGNGDGIVTSADFTEWVNNYGTTYSPSAPLQGAPEPTALLLMLVAAAPLAARRRG